MWAQLSPDGVPPNQIVSVCLPLSIFPCTIKSRSSLLAPAHPDARGKRAIKWLRCGGNKHTNIAEWQMRPELTVTLELQLLLSKADSMQISSYNLSQNSRLTWLQQNSIHSMDFELQCPYWGNDKKNLVRDACIVHKAFTKWGVLKARTGTLVNASEYRHSIDHILWSNASKIHWLMDCIVYTLGPHTTNTA